MTTETQAPVFSPDAPFDGNQVGDANIKTAGDLATAYKTMRETHAPSDGSHWGPPGVLGGDAQQAARQQFYESEVGKQALNIVKEMGANKNQAEKIQSAFYQVFTGQREAESKNAEAMKPVIEKAFGNQENYTAFQESLKDNPELAKFAGNPVAYAFAEKMAARSKASGASAVAGGGGGTPAGDTGESDAPADAPTFNAIVTVDGKRTTKAMKVDYRNRDAIGDFLQAHGNEAGGKAFYQRLLSLHQRHEQTEKSQAK